MRKLLLLAAALSGIATIAVMSPAHAGFMFNLSASGPGVGFTGSGSIDFTALSGTSTADVDAFSFHVTGPTGSIGAEFGSPQNYALTDINTISWSINSSDALTLALTSNLLPFGADQSGLLLNNTGADLLAPCGGGLGTTESATCLKSSTGGIVSLDGAGLTATFVPQVPEPGTLALLAPTLLGIAAYRRRRKI
jgi:hypothetical protein